MKTLTEEQAKALLAFLDAFDQVVTGVWPHVERHMLENWGVGNPEEALEEARQALQS